MKYELILASEISIHLLINKNKKLLFCKKCAFLTNQIDAVSLFDFNYLKKVI